MKKNIIFLDIETDSLEVDAANIKFIGLFDEDNNYTNYQYDKKDYNMQVEIQNKLNKYDKIITFNGNNFDLPIMRNHNFEINYWQSIDLYEIFKKRAPLLKSGGYKSYSLKNIAKEIKLKINKGDIDYQIFQKNKWTPEELKEINIYLKRDLELTSQMWNFLKTKFESFKEFISKKDSDSFKHITSSSGSFAYKVLCNALKIPEIYLDKNEIVNKVPYKGGYVKNPIKLLSNNPVIYFDFTSLYPMLYIQNNLFSHKCSCCKDYEKWSGNKLFKVEGKYCKKQQGQIEKLIKKFYLQRKQYKLNKDKKEFALKIFLNTLYGISSKPTFKQIYYKYTATDCTLLGRQCLKYAIKRFNEEKFNVLYADTDSCFVEIVNNNKEKCLNLAKTITKELIDNMNFPWEEFKFKIEDEIKYIQFFKDKQGKLKKKNYIYINNDNNMVIKGIDIVKKNCSQLSLKIFNEYLKNNIIKNKSCLFNYNYIDNLIKDILKKDLKILAKRFNIRDSNYKSKTSLYKLIKDKYGSGEIFLIKNKLLGAGKSIKYCSLEESNSLNLNDLDLEDIYKELSYFIKEVQHEL